MKRLFKNDGTLLFGYWIREHWQRVPQSYLQWGCENVPDFDLQLERLKAGLDPIPGIHDGTKAIPVMKPPVRKSFVSKTVRPCNHSPSPAAPSVMPNVINDQQIQDLRHCIADGMSRAKTSRVLGISRVTIDRLVAKHGLPKPRDGRKDNKVAPEISRLGRETYKAKRESTTPAPTLEMRNDRICWTAEIDAQIELWLSEGKSWRSIAKALGFKKESRILQSRYYVHRTTLKQHNAPRQQEPIIQPTPVKKRGLFGRLWDAFLNVTDGPI